MSCGQATLGRVRVPTLALFGAAHDPRVWGPVGAGSAWVVEEMACASCFLAEARQCAINVACMDLLSPDRVWPLVERHILKTPSATPPPDRPSA